MSVSLPEDVETTPAASPRVRRRLWSAQEQRDRRRRVVLWGLSAGLGVLLVNALVGENGYLATRRARQEHDALQAAVARIRIENQQLQQESRSLQTEPSAVADAARRELGFVGPGETLVVLRDVEPGSRPARR